MTVQLTTSQRIAAGARLRTKAARRGRRADQRTAPAGKLHIGYARISEDDEEMRDGQRTRAKTELGVKRQQRAGNAKATDLRLGKLRWFVDNDISGGDFTDRAEYDAMLELIESGAVATVIATELERFSREPLEQQEFLLICEVYGVRVICTEDGTDIDHGKAGAEDAVAVATIKQAIGALDRAKVRRRVRNKHLELAEAGKPHGGRRRYGFEPDNITHRPDEVETIHQMRDLLLVGYVDDDGTKHGPVKALTLAKMLNYAGVPTAAGTNPETGEPYLWYAATIKKMLLSDHIVGVRVHQGVEHKAVWKGIITKAEQAKLRTKLAGQAVGPRARVALLVGGMIRCGLCGHKLHTKTKHGRRLYVCFDRGDGACGRLSIDAERVEAVVVDAFFERLRANYGGARRRAKDPADKRAAAIAKVDEMQARVDGLVDLYADGLMSEAKYRTKHAQLSAKLKAAQVALGAIPDGNALAELADGYEQLRGDWNDLDLDAQRAALLIVLDYVTIGSATVPKNVFNPKRLSFTWKS